MEEEKESKKIWYDKNYKKLLLIPALILAISLIFIFNFNAQHGDIVLKDVTLTGGTSIDVFDSNVDINEIKASLKE